MLELQTVQLTIFSVISIITLVVVYFFLISEKLPKPVVAILGAVVLIVMQVFKSGTKTSQENAFEFISHNLDILGFVIGMMLLVGIVRESGAFEALAIYLVKLVKGNPVALLVVFGYLTLFMTAVFSNIPTVLILVPVLLVLIRELKLPPMPYLFVLVTMANIGGAMTSISDPTTYYQAKTVGLTFFEVVQNSGTIVMLCSVISLVYIYVVFQKSLRAVTLSKEAVALFNPLAAIHDRYILKVGIPTTAVCILLMIFKNQLFSLTGIYLDNATITLGAAFLCILLFHKDPKDVFKNVIDWEIIFFFMGLFIIVGALEFTQVIKLLAGKLILLTGGSVTWLLFIISVGSGVISTFIDNVPYNITMVSAVFEMQKAGIYVYPLWWALNLGTSIGGAGSPIAAACNVLAFGQAEREGIHANFVKYLVLALPLVLLNSLVTFGVLWFRFVR